MSRDQEGKKEKREQRRREKEKEASAGFATPVASRAWRRREATRTRNEENMKKSLVATDAGVGTANRREMFREIRDLEKI